MGLLLLVSAFSALAVAQQLGSVNPEVHPTLLTQKCTASGGCVVQNTKIVLDANWRWVHNANNQNCYSGNNWDYTICPDPDTCAQQCYLDGADYQETYGVYASGDNLTLLLYPPGQSDIGSRVYLMSDDSHYQLINLKNQEFTFDVDVSSLPCGANGAVYFTNMAADGGTSQYPNNQAGAARGTGYCDSQCPQDIKFINGEANTLDWNTTTTTGRYGSCCHEMDIWEANAVSTAFTAHPCSTFGQYRCDGEGTQCGSTGLCDKSGCDFNPYRMGNHTFYGHTGTVKTTPGYMRVITEFHTDDGTANGTLSSIIRSYIRGGKLVFNSKSDIKNVAGNSLNTAYCAAEKKAFGESNYFATVGGMRSMSKAMDLGMVLTLSVWVDYAADMNWLDSIYPNGATGPGAKRGTCSPSVGDPSYVQAHYPNAKVKFSNIKYGDFGTTFGPPYP